MTDNLDQHILAHLAGGRWWLIGTDNGEVGLTYVTAAKRRAVEDAIQRLRLAGHPIVGGDAGVKLTSDPLEVRAYAQDRRRRLVSIAKGTRALLNTARRMEAPGPQGTLWGDRAA
jgi:hypothetical protein